MGLLGAGAGAAAAAGAAQGWAVWVLALAAVGAACALRAALAALGGVWRALLAPGADLRGRYGGWAVVTGATDGIGRALALRLAALGFPVCVVSRTPPKLEALREELLSAGAPEARTVQLDFAAAGDADWARVRSELSGIDVGVLVNNVGQSYAHAEYLHNLEDGDIDRLIRVNCSGTVRMTKIALEGMVARRQRSAILNVGSGAATVMPSEPLYSGYAGTKGLVDEFSRSLAVEYADFGVDVELHAPMLVSTKMAQPGRRSTNTFIPSAAGYARASLRRLGDGQLRCSPYWSHALMWGVISLLPEALVDRMRLGQCKTIRKKALRRKERLAAKAK